MKIKFKIIRISLFFILIAAFYLLPKSFFFADSFCPIYSFFNVKCPSCGATRALYEFLHLDFSSAADLNLPFTVALFPIALYLLADDFFTLVKSLVTKKEAVSLADTAVNLFVK